jgi:undecaprenyl diphosphate synthase
MAYDGREELQAAAESFARSGARGSLGEHLWTAHLPPVDLLIRTGGQPHLSAGFLAWGLAEAQLCFSPTLWPDFEEEALARALADYAASERRFGR